MISVANMIIIGAILTSRPGRYKHSKENNMRWFKQLYDRIRLELRYRKKLRELRKRDPFIYK